MTRTFKVGQTVYHGSRYWKSEGLEAGEVLGWNTLYLPYEITKITNKRIVIDNATAHARMMFGRVVLWLNRATMEREGKQYHSRFHEYFYAEKPRPESKDWNWAGSKPDFVIPNLTGDCLITLGLSTPYTKADVRRAYKRLAKNAHPDLGGSHHAFIKLKQAHDSALRFAST